MLKAGDQAPDFTVADDSGQQVSLSGFRGRNVVLYFYPRADTPGCTIESCEFRDALSRFDAVDAGVLGISPDTGKAQAKFKEKYGLNFRLLADADHAIADKYGVWKEKSMIGKKYFGVERTTFLIDRTGRISRVFEKVKAQGHANEVAQALVGA